MACRSAVRWLYRLDDHYSWKSPLTFERDWAFQDAEGHTRLVLAADGTITVLKGYAWDGCTPKICILDLLLGTPDGAVFQGTGKPKTYYASLVHDALYQFLPEMPDGKPLDRARADLCFLRLMEEHEFALRYVYYFAVRAFGGLTRPITRRIRDTYGGRGIECA